MKKIETITISITKDFSKGSVHCSAACQFDMSGVKAVEAIALASSDCDTILDAIVEKVKTHLEATGSEVTFAEPPPEIEE